MADRKESVFTQETAISASNWFFRALDNNEALASNKNKIVPTALVDARYQKTGVTVYNSNSAENISASGIYVVASTTEDVNLPVSPSSDQWVRIKNRASIDVSVNYNGGVQIYTSSAKNSIILLPGNSIYLVYDGTYWSAL